MALICLVESHHPELSDSSAWETSKQVPLQLFDVLDNTPRLWSVYGVITCRSFNFETLITNRENKVKGQGWRSHHKNKKNTSHFTMVGLGKSMSTNDYSSIGSLKVTLPRCLKLLSQAQSTIWTEMNPSTSMSSQLRLLVFPLAPTAK